MAVPFSNSTQAGSTADPNDPVAVLKQALAQGNSTSSNTNFSSGGLTNPQVYWGKSPAEGEFNFITGKMEGTGVPYVGESKYKSAYEASYDIYGWSSGEKEAWGKRMYSLGMIEDPYDWDGMVKAWSWAVEQAAGYQAAGKDITPWGFVSMYENDRQAAGLGMGGGVADYQGPRTQTSTNTAVNLPSQSDAEATVQQLFKEQMGRDATDHELARYSSMLIGGYRDHPQTTTSTTTTTPDEFAPDGSVINQSSRTTSTSTGAFNPSGMLTKKAQADPEYGAYQAATTYFNALMQAIGAPGS